MEQSEIKEIQVSHRGRTFTGFFYPKERLEELIAIVGEENRSNCKIAIGTTRNVQIPRSPTAEVDYSRGVFYNPSVRNTFFAGFFAAWEKRVTKEQ